jgi:integrase
MGRQDKTRENHTPTAPQPAKILTTIGVAKLKPKLERYEVRDAGCHGLRVVVQPSGYRSFHLRLWFRGKAYNLTLGPVLEARSSSGDTLAIGAPLTLADARVLAAQCLRRVKTGTHPKALKPRDTNENSVQGVADEYLKREGRKLRRVAQRKYDLGLICASLGSRPIVDVKLSDIVRLRDKIEEENGPMAASRALTSWQTLAGWHASRTDDFRPPIIRRLKTRATKRSRILSDDELRAVWKAADAFEGPFGRYIQFLLLTAVRRSEAAGMRRSELVTAETWVIPSARYKTKTETTVPLSKAAQNVISKLPVIAPGDLIFTNDGIHQVGGVGRHKKDISDISGITDWTLHDLRRTARTLLSRAGVDSDIAERCLGHAIGGVRAVYDRHEFEPEKRKAFEVLAG